MQRRGHHPRLIEATLGHGSLELTYGVYGGWTPEQFSHGGARIPDGVRPRLRCGGPGLGLPLVWKPAAVLPGPLSLPF